MALSYFLLGFVIKFITGIDDTLTKIPLIYSLGVNKSRSRKVAYGLGVLLAVAISLIIAFFFSSFIKQFPYSRYIAASLVFILAIVIYFGLFENKEDKHVKHKIARIKGKSYGVLFEIFAISFIVSMITLLDDIIAFVPLYLNGIAGHISTTAGIFLATLIQIGGAIYFAKHLSKIKYQKEIASATLIVLSILILYRVI